MDNQPPEPPKEDVASAAGPTPMLAPQQIQPQVPPPTRPHPLPNTTGPLMPGQVIGSNSATTQQPTPVETPASPMPQAVVGNLPTETSPNNRKKWLLIVVGIVVLALIIIAAVFFLKPKDKNDNITPQKQPQQSSSISSDDETSSWKTYSDKVITLKYPDGWSVKQIPNIEEGNLNIMPAGSPDRTGYIGEDTHTDNAKTSSSKAYWQRAYNSDNSEKIIAENSDPVNGYDTYNVEAKDSTFGSMTYSVVGKSGTKITVYYPTNDKNNDTYEKIVSTIKLN